MFTISIILAAFKKEISRVVLMGEFGLLLWLPNWTSRAGGKQLPINVSALYNLTKRG